MKMVINKPGNGKAAAEKRKLRSLGYRVTAQRMAVLETLGQMDGHVTPQELHAHMCRFKAGIGLVTVYRALKMLTEAGLACEVELNGGSRHYIRRSPAAHHHHLICLGCDGVTDFSNCALPALEKRLSQVTGFSIQQHRLEFYGLCRDCQAQGKGKREAPA